MIIIVHQDRRAICLYWLAVCMFMGTQTARETEDTTRWDGEAKGTTQNHYKENAHEKKKEKETGKTIWTSGRATLLPHPQEGGKYRTAAVVLIFFHSNQAANDTHRVHHTHFHPNVHPRFRHSTQPTPTYDNPGHKHTVCSRFLHVRNENSRPQPFPPASLFLRRAFGYSTIARRLPKQHPPPSPPLPTHSCSPLSFLSVHASGHTHTTHT